MGSAHAAKYIALSHIASEILVRHVNGDDSWVVESMGLNFRRDAPSCGVGQRGGVSAEWRGRQDSRRSHSGSPVTSSISSVNLELAEYELEISETGK